MAQWDKSNDEKVLELRKQGLSPNKIAKQLNVFASDVKNFLARHARLVKNGGVKPTRGGGKNRLPAEEFNKRMDVYKSGVSDKVAGVMLKISPKMFCHWRWKNNLPPNENKDKRTYNLTKPRSYYPKHKTKVDKEKVVLTNNDLLNYNHNKKATLPTCRAKEATRIVDIGLAEKYAQQAKAKPVIAPLADMMKVKKNMMDLSVTANRSFGGDFVRC